MEFYGKAIFFCENPILLSILDEFLEVTVVKNIDQILHLEADFLFLDSNTPSIEKVCHFSKHYINKNIVIFYCGILEELENLKINCDDYISLPCSIYQVKYKLRFWNKKRIKSCPLKTDKTYILEKIDFFINQASILAKDQPHLSFQLFSIEWLNKFLHIQNNELNDTFIESIFDFIKIFLEQFNAKVLIKLSFSIQILATIHQRNLLQILLCLSRICCIYNKSVIRVKRIEENIYIYIDKKPDFLKEYLSCILFKKIIEPFKKYWQIQKLQNGTLFKYTLFEDR